MNCRARSLWLFVFAAAMACQAGPHEVTPAQIAAEQAYDAAKANYLARRGDADLAWQFARACFDRADTAPTDTERAAVAREGITVCRQALAQTNAAPAHYYLGLNLAELARTKRFGALHLLHEMEKEWVLTLSMDRSLDYAGADRALGLLFRDAPDPPLSLGNRAKSLYHLQRALDLAPQYPENHLNLIETDLKWHKNEEARQQLAAWLKALPAQRQGFSSPHWQFQWQDWDSRAAKIEARLRARR